MTSHWAVILKNKRHKELKLKEGNDFAVSRQNLKQLLRPRVASSKKRYVLRILSLKGTSLSNILLCKDISPILLVIESPPALLLERRAQYQ